ncbi:hypothetical protein GUJ93_ZPchr0002g24962 [Zizania palustris]|uniref:Uncharacterized protein n=1 Tax=Zizania palustris TaxID=103762 RepID=A0A8J5V4A6_ZIZPA|nr:hypothetical protein GUJ93_ZPchr0002g24962 [Zizania palustris]
MELSVALEERVQQIEFGRNHRLSLLHVSPFLLLSFPKRRTKPSIARPHRPRAWPRLSSAQRSSASSTRSSPLPRPREPRHRPHLPRLADIDVARAAGPATSGSRRAAEREEDDWDRFYEAKTKEMEEFQAMAGRFEAEARKEVQMLRNLLKSTLQEHCGGVMYLNNAEIAAAEARKASKTGREPCFSPPVQTSEHCHLNLRISDSI